MTEVRRTRTPPAPVEVRQRRVRPAPAATDYTVQRAVSSISGYGEGEAVTIILKLTAEVTSGNMHRGELEMWVKNALHDYHRFRNGFVGYSASAKIKLPRCVRIDKVAD